MTEPAPTAPATAAAGVTALAWQTLRGYEDPDRYRDIAGTEHAEVLGEAPAALARVADQQGHGHARAYLTHSCDLTLSGGLSTAVAAPLGACALPERGAGRPVGGAGVAAFTATAVAAAEYARGTGATASGREDDPVVAPATRASRASRGGWPATMTKSRPRTGGGSPACSSRR